MGHPSSEVEWAVGMHGSGAQESSLYLRNKLDPIRFSEVFETTAVEGVQKGEGRAGVEEPVVFS